MTTRKFDPAAGTGALLLLPALVEVTFTTSDMLADANMPEMADAFWLTAAMLIHKEESDVPHHP